MAWASVQKNKRTNAILLRYTLEKINVLKETCHSHVESFKKREGNNVAWVDLCFRLNVGFELACEYFKEEAIAETAKALGGLCDIKDRWSRMGKKWGAKEEELELLNVGLQVTDALVEMTSHKEHCAVYKKVQAQMNNAIR